MRSESFWLEPPRAAQTQAIRTNTARQTCWDPSVYKHSRLRCGCQQRITASSTEAAKAGGGQEVTSYHPWVDALGLEARDEGESNRKASTGTQEEEQF